jgi:hypothetical protein
MKVMEWLCKFSRSRLPMTLDNSLSDVAIACMTLTIVGLGLKHKIADDIGFE